MARLHPAPTGVDEQNPFGESTMQCPECQSEDLELVDEPSEEYECQQCGFHFWKDELEDADESSD